MPRVSTRIINIFAFFLIIVGCYFLVSIVSPKSNLTQAELSCGHGNQKIQFSDMNACTDHPSYHAGGCSCGPVKNPFYAQYHFGVVPFIVALFGCLLFKGSIGKTIILVNSAFVINMFSTFAIEVSRNTEAIIGIFFVLIYAVVYCLVLTLWVCVIYESYSWFKRFTHAT